MKLAIDATHLETYLDALTTTVDEAPITATKNGLHTQAVDPAHILMADATLSAGNAVGYEPTGDTYGIDLDKLADALGPAQGDDTVTLRVEDNTLHVEYANLHRQMRLVDTDNLGSPDIPDLDLNVELSVERGEFKRGVEAALTVTDTVTFETDGEEFVMRAEGDLDTVRLTLPGPQTGNNDDLPSAQSMYAAGRLMTLQKAMPPVNRVKVAYKTDHPARIAWDSGEVSVEYLLAPRIENE